MLFRSWLGVWVLLLWAAVGHHGGTALDSAAHHGAAHSHLTLSVSWVATLVMWALMAVAMMAPTAVPMLQAYADIRHGRSLEWWLFLGGYLAVWVGTASVMSALQQLAHSTGWVTGEGASRSTTLTAVLLVIAGGYQLTDVKRRCLTQCSRPMTFLMRFWRDGASGALRLGLRHGITCVGCCWALMMLAFVGGVMNPWFMVGGSVLMVLEKLPAIQRRLTVPLGVVLLLAGVLTFVAGPGSGRL